MKPTRIYKAIINLLLVVLCNAVNAQTDPDFLKLKKLADDCFNIADYACAEKNYKAASTINEKDTFCKQRITESQTKKANQLKQAERRRKEEDRLEEIRVAEEDKKYKEEQEAKARHEEETKIINEIVSAISLYKKNENLSGVFNTLKKYENKTFFWDEANYVLGKMYSDGNPIEQDYAKAREYFNKSVAYNKSQYELALLYKNGRGVPKNEEKALELFYFTAQSGNSEAIHEYALMKLNGEGCEKDYNEAFKWFDTNKSYPSSVPYLAFMYYHGYGVAKNKEQAFYLFSNSKELNLSKEYLAWMYYYGDGIIVDYEKALYYCKETDSNSDSQFLLAKLYMSDLEIKISFLESLALKLMYNRDFLLNQKLSKQEKVKLAEYYLNKSIDNNNSNAKKWTIISGHVSPLTTIGCSISIKGTTKGTNTNVEGFFSLMLEDLPETKTIVFSFVGYLRQDVVIKKSHTDLTVTLYEDNRTNRNQEVNKTVYLDLNPSR